MMASTQVSNEAIMWSTIRQPDPNETGDWEKFYRATWRDYLAKRGAVSVVASRPMTNADRCITCIP